MSPIQSIFSSDICFVPCFHSYGKLWCSPFKLCFLMSLYIFAPLDCVLCALCVLARGSICSVIPCKSRKTDKYFCAHTYYIIIKTVHLLLKCGVIFFFRIIYLHTRIESKSKNIHFNQDLYVLFFCSAVIPVVCPPQIKCISSSLCDVVICKQHVRI